MHIIGAYNRHNHLARLAGYTNYSYTTLCSRLGTGVHVPLSGFALRTALERLEGRLRRVEKARQSRYKVCPHSL
jgi:hypothetical protein